MAGRWKTRRMLCLSMNHEHTNMSSVTGSSSGSPAANGTPKTMNLSTSCSRNGR